MVDKIIGGKGFGPLDNIKRSGKAGAAKQSGPTGKSDRVDFSSTLQSASKAQAAKSPQETARAEKLQALKSQIESGSYQPDLGKVASSMLPFLFEDT